LASSLSFCLFPLGYGSQFLFDLAGDFGGQA